MAEWKDRRHLAIHALFRRLPTGVVSAIGAGVGHVAGRGKGPTRRRRASETITRFGAPIDPAVAGGIWCRNLGRTLAEVATLDRLWPEGRIAVQGAEHLETGAHPLLVVGVHTGNWEVLAPALAGLGRSPCGIYAPPANAVEHALIAAARRSYGARLIPPSPMAARDVLRTMQAGRETVLIYIDEWKNDRVHAPAFGRPLQAVGNIALVARLAARTGALVVPAIPERLSGARFRVRFLPPLRIAPEEPLLAAIARIDAVIEPEIRRLLPQWLMAYVWPLQDRARQPAAAPGR